MSGHQSLAYRTRRQHKKVRSGCVTCKARRVKCDEERPSCSKCLHLFGRCGGYTLSLVTIPASVEPKFHILRQKPTSDLCQQPSLAIFTATDEQRYFHLFVHKISYGLSGFMVNPLWTKLVLQACHADPAIRHGVIAISALSFLHHRNITHEAGDLTNNHKQFALHQYDIAIKALRRAAVRRDMSLDSILITCVVIVCFENMYGNSDGATAQIAAGLKLLLEKRRLSLQSPIDDLLIQAFIRLEVQYMCYNDTRPREVHTMLQHFGQALMSCMPKQFLSINQARKYYIIILQRSLHTLALFDSTGYVFRNMSSLIPEAFVDVGKAHLRDILAWNTAFLSLRQNLEVSPSSKESLILTSLEMGHNLTHITFDCLLSTRPCIREFMPAFIEIVRLGRIISDHPSIINAESSFAADIQMICPIAMVARNCPHRTVRREAIALLLETPRREGLWDSMFAGKTAEFIMRLEEQSDMDGDYVRQESLHRGLKADVDLPRRRAALTVYMPVPATDDIVSHRGTIRW